MRQLLRWPVIATAIGLILSMLVLPAATGSAALGPCTIRWIGADGAWETAANWREEGTAVNRVPVGTDTVCIDDANPLTSRVVTLSSGATVAGIDNAESLRVASGITLTQGAEIVNRGVFELSNSADVVPNDAGAPVERFTNTGTLRATSYSNEIYPGITVDNVGTIDVTFGVLNVHNVGTWPGNAPTIAAGAELNLWVTAASDLYGTWTSTGDGVMRVFGTLQPKTAPLTLGFAADRLQLGSVTLDGSVQPIRNTGVLPLDDETIVGDASAGLGLTNPAGAEVRQSGSVGLAPGAVVHNEGLWTMSNSADIVPNDAGAPVERFTNTGTLRATSYSNEIYPGITVDNVGTIDVTFGVLNVHNVGTWPGNAPTIAAGAELNLWVTAASDLYGTWTSTGDGVMRVFGTLQPKTAPLTLGFAADRLQLGSVTLDGSVQPIRNTGVLPLDDETIVGDASAGLGLTNPAGAEVRQSGSVGLAPGAVVHNEGLWTMSNSGDIVPNDAGAPVERFTNTGTLRATSYSNEIYPGITVDNVGTIDVTFGVLNVHNVGTWPGNAPTIAAGAELNLWVTAASDLYGTWTSTGDGVMRVFGTLQPKTAPLTLGFAADRLQLGSVTLDGSVQPIRNTGVLPLDDETIVGDASAGLGLTNPAGAEVRQSGSVGLAPGAVVHNEGLWTMSNSGDIVPNDAGAPVERFTNTGTLRATSYYNEIYPGITVDNVGTIDVTFGALNVHNAVPQVSGAILNGGTWRVAGALELLASPQLTTIGSGASVELVGSGSLSQLAALAGVSGSLRLSGGKDLTTGPLLNLGTIAVGPQSTLSVNGTFTNSGTFVTGISGAPATGQFGDLVASGSLALGGTGAVERDAAYSPAPTDVFTILRGADVTSQFGTVDAAGFTHAYTSNAFVLNGTGSVPIAAAGPDLTVTEATPPLDLVLDGTGSTDVDGTIATYGWTTNPVGIALTSASTAQAGFHAADDAAFTATLEVCDNTLLCDTDSAQVTVSNSAPTLALAPVGPTVQQGVEVTVSATYADAGSLDTHTATVDWGPGEPQPVAAAGGTISAANTYTAVGSHTIAVCVTDDDGGVACATADISVVRPDPEAGDDDATFDEDTAIDIAVLDNDIDPDTPAAQLSVASAGAAGHGATTVVERAVRYSPATDFCGTDSFTYVVTDGSHTDTGTVTTTVTCVNDPPVADAGADLFIEEGAPQAIAAAASDVDGDTLVASWSPAAGLEDPAVLAPTALAADDAVTTYTLTVCDPALACAVDTTTVTIVNATPQPVTADVRTLPGTPVGPVVTFTDRGTLDTHTATVLWPGDVTATDLGPVTSPIDLPDRTLTEPGLHVVQVCVTDDDGAVGCANQSILVRSDLRPDAVDDTFAIDAGSSANALDVLANDTDADRDPIIIIDTTAPSAGGTVACTTSSCTYTPAPGLRGTETFTYTVADNLNGEDTATVTLTVSGVNHAPDASLGLDPTTGLAPLVVTATIGGTDPDDDPLTAVVDWGDGSAPVTIALPVATPPVHSYVTPGTYVVRLAVSDADATDVVTALVRVGNPEPLVADAGDDQVVALGETVRLDGSASRPTVGTDGATWVVRNATGDPVASDDGLVVEWTPTAAGTYSAGLTLSLAGDQDGDTAIVTVVDPAAEPGLLVTVRGGGALLDGADVLALDADGVRFAGVTGSDGTTRLLGLPDGAVKVYAFAPGYLPVPATAVVADGSGSLTIDLTAGEVVQTVLESRRLTIDEIVGLGIDPNDPNNQNVFEFEIHLAFTPGDPDPVVLTGYTTGNGIVGGQYSNGGGEGGFSVGTGVPAGPYTVYPTVRTVGGQPIIIWLVIPGEARWLKEFFEVRMVVSNLAPEPFTFAAGTASLDALPDGLSLAPTAEPQQLAQSLPDIPAGGSAAATWIVRGDTTGDYELTANYAASLEPIGAPLSMVARTAAGALKVWGGDALFMRVLAEERLIEGHPYRVVVEMENVSDIPVYNLAVELKEEGKLNYIYQPREELTRNIAELAPGETLSADFVLVPTVGIFTPLELLEEISFVKKTGGNTEIASTIESVPPRYADADRPPISVSRSGGDITITWAAVPGATDYQLFATSAPELAFDTTPLATVASTETSITLPLTAALVGKHIAVSPTVDGRPDMVHRRVALLGGSFVSVADEPSEVDRVAIVGDGLMAGAGLAGADPCGRSAGAFAALLAADLGVAGSGVVNTACDGATAGNVAFAPAGPSLDDGYVVGPQASLTTTQAQDVGTFATGGAPDLVLAGFGAEDLGLDAILGECGHACDTRWRFQAQQVLRDRVYPRVYENLRALRATHPGAVVVAFTPPTPVAAGSACAVGSGTGITSAESRFLADELYPWLQTTVRRAAINAGVNVVDVTPALAGHEACTTDPWVNSVVFDTAGAMAPGAFLPNVDGHEAIAAYLRGVVVDDGQLLLQNPGAQVLRVLAPQEEAPFVVPVTAVQAGACELTTCALHVTVGGLRHGDRVNLLVDEAAPDPADAAAGLDGTVDVTVQVPRPDAPTPVLVEVSSFDRNLRGSTVATIGVPVNRPPVGGPDSTTVDEDGVAVVDVVANDTDPDVGDVLTVLPNLVTGPAHGTAAVEDDVVLGRRVVRYQPAAGYCGADTFTYEITDSGDLRSTAAVNVTVTCVNDAPALVAPAPVTVPEGTPATLGVGVTDPDSTAFRYSWTPVAGLSDPTVASPTFTPTDDGTTAFAVTVCDDGTPQACAELADAAVVTATNVAPTVVAAADATIRARSPLVLAPIATYTDPGAADTHTATVTWGDGSVDAPVAVIGGTVAATHTYTTAGSFTAQVCVADDDGGSVCDSLAVTVQPAGPAVSVGDVAIGEPDSGTVNVVVPVTLSAAPARNVAVRIETVDGSAVAPDDYTAKAATITFTPTGPLTRTVTVAVRGDLLAEPDEVFSVRVVEPATVEIIDGTGAVTITNDDECTVLGTTGNDTSLTGTPGDDVICALGGDDVIDGLGGNDQIRGDAGVDTVTYLTAPAGIVVDLAGGTATDRGTQTLVGIEQVYGSEHDDTLTGGTGADLLVGLGGADTITGGAGNDDLDGGDGADVLTAGDGADFVYGGDGNDQLLGQAGNDRLDGEAGDDVVDGGDGLDTLRGGAGTDQLTGGLAADELSGGGGDDVLAGGDGNDTVQGEDGNDTITGGIGDDLLLGDDGDDSLFGEAGRDRLNGGHGINVLDGGDGIDSCRLGSTATACERP